MTFGKRQAKYGISSSIAIILVLVILASINYIAQKHNVRQDLTKNQIYTLSDHTKKILESLTQDVTVTCFFQDNNESKLDVKTLLKEYEYISSFFHVDFFDPVSRPDLVEKFNVTRDGTIIFQMGDRRQETFGTGEMDLTSGLLKLIKDRKKSVLYFSTGHDELDITSYDQNFGLSHFKEAVEREQFTLKEINLAAVPSIPEDAAALCIVGPKVPFLDVEIETMRKFADEGGNFYILLDSPMLEQNRIPDLAPLLDEYGIRADQSLVLDFESSVRGQPAMPYIGNIGWHQITKDFKLGIVMVGARSLSPLKQIPPNVGIEKLGQTLAQETSWGETDMSQAPPVFNKGKDIEGPVIVAVAIERKTPLTSTDTVPESSESDPSSEEKKSDEKDIVSRMVLIGDSDIVTNTIFYELGNSDFLLNSINWLCQEEDLISIRPKTPDVVKLEMTPQRWKIVLLIVILCPMLFLAAGIMVWWKRR